MVEKITSGTVVRRNIGAMAQDIDEARNLIPKYMLGLGLVGVLAGVLFSGGLLGVLLSGAAGACLGLAVGFGKSGMGSYTWGMPSRRQMNAIHEMRAERAEQKILENNNVPLTAYEMVKAQPKPIYADKVLADRQVALNAERTFPLSF